MSNKPQATKHDDTPKTPFSKKLGRGTTGVTAGTLYGAGRGLFHFSKNFGAGVAEKFSEIKAGYDEAKAEAKE